MLATRFVSSSLVSYGARQPLDAARTRVGDRYAKLALIAAGEPLAILDGVLRSKTHTAWLISERVSAWPARYLNTVAARNRLRC